MLLDEYSTKIKVYPEEVILAYIQKYITDDYEYKTNDKGHWINIPSPFYHDKRKRLGFNIDSGVIFDFKLQQPMDFEKFIFKHQTEVLGEEKFTRPKAEQIIFKLRSSLRKNGYKLGDFTARPRQMEEDGAIQLPQLDEEDVPVGLESFEKEKIMRNKMGRKAVIYLQTREFNSEIINKFDLKYIDHELCPVCFGKRMVSESEKCPQCKGWGKYKFHGRIFVPTYEEGRLVYFQARDYLNRDKKWKYLNPKVSRKQVVYFYDNLPERDRIFAAEGPFDAMYLHNYPATALMGNKMSRAFAQKLLWKKPKEVVFIPDFDTNIETRKQIFSNLAHNIKKIREEADYNIDVGVYNWFELTSAKDLNAGGINYIDDSLIIHPIKDKLRFKDMVRGVLNR